MTAADPLLVETVERLLASTATFDTVEAAEAARWCAPVWDALAEAGFPWISVDEKAGGSGGSLADAMAVLRSAGRHAAPVPLAETGVLGGWLSAAAGFALPSGPLSVISSPSALSISGGRLTGSAVVAWAERAERILALVGAGSDDARIVSLTPSQVTVEPRTNMAGEPRDLVTVDVALSDVESAPAPEGVSAEALLRRGALSRVVLAAGALDAMAQLTIDYTHGRNQFGKPLSSFQAVQIHLVTAAQCAARTGMAADVATRALAAGDGAFEVAAAVVVADAASVEATRAAHQAHGAMGVTREYALHHLSRRLWAWRHEYRPAKAWRDELGRSVAAAGADALFPTIAR